MLRAAGVAVGCVVLGAVRGRAALPRAAGLDLLSSPVRVPDRTRRDGHVRLRVRSPVSARSRPSAKAAHELVVIDHHVSNERYGTINVIDPHAAASGVVVRDLVTRARSAAQSRRRGCACSPRSCATPAVSSTTRTTPAVFDLARELAEFDLPIATLSRTLFEEHRFAYLQLLATVLCSARCSCPEQRFVWTAVTQADLATARRHDGGGRGSDRRGAPHPKEADVSAVLKEDPDGCGAGEHAQPRRGRRVRDRAGFEGGGGTVSPAGFTSA